MIIAFLHEFSVLFPEQMKNKLAKIKQKSAIPVNSKDLVVCLSLAMQGGPCNIPCFPPGRMAFSLYCQHGFSICSVYINRGIIMIMTEIFVFKKAFAKEID